MQTTAPILLAKVVAALLALGALLTFACNRPASSRNSPNYELSYPLIYPSRP